MQEIENIVRYRFKIEFNEESAYYYCFITIEFFAQRLVEYKKQNKQEDVFFESNAYVIYVPMTKKDKSWFILMMIYLMELLKECIREIIVVQENFQMCL